VELLRLWWTGFFGALKKRGLVETVKLLFYEFWFDWRYGVETRKIIPRSKMRFGADLKHELFVHYQGASPTFLERALHSLSPEAKEGSFLDIGCGKGRALIVAAEAGFPDIIGVEISEPLCVLARKNLEAYQKKFSKSLSFKIHTQDATSYQIPKRVSCILMFNPFVGEAFSKVLDEITRAPQKICVIYINAVEKEQVMRSGLKIDEVRSCRDYLVFCNY